MVAVDGAGTGVVGGEGERDVVLVAGEQLVEVLGAAFDVLGGGEGVGDTKCGGGAGHELHEAAGAGAGDGAGVAARLGADDGGEQVGVDVVGFAGVGEELGELLLCGFKAGELGAAAREGLAGGGKGRVRGLRGGWVGDGFYRDYV